jgi:hypothetical protein
MNHSFQLFLSILLISIVLSCNTDNGNHNIGLVNPETFMYGFNEAETKVSWNAYKTTDKVKVMGYFETLTTDRTGMMYNSIQEFVNGIKFSINSSSSFSGDAARDISVRDYFFNLFTENFEINGTLEIVSPKQVTAYLDIYGTDTPVLLSYDVSEGILLMKGSISLNEIGAINAYNSIHEKCIDLHRGIDGISKTWDTVDISIEIPVIKDCR